MLTTSQLRAARALLGMTADELSAASGISTAAIQQFEAAGGATNADLSQRLKIIFESKGIEFIAAGENGAGAGLRFREHFPDDGIRPEDLNSTNDG